MKEKTLKKLLIVPLALSMAFGTISVHADAPSPGEVLDMSQGSVTSYYVIIESPNGGIPIYPRVNSTEPLLNGELIPTGTVLFIDQEITDPETRRIWGHTKFQETEGYVMMDDCSIVGFYEGLNRELEAGNAYDTNYMTTIDSDNGSTTFYQGPGEKYGILPGGENIPNGESYQIFLEAELPDGTKWAQTSQGNLQAWVSQDDLSNTTAGPKATPTPLPTPTNTPTPTPSPSPSPTPSPEPTETPTPEPTEEVTEAPAEEVTEAPAATATEAAVSTEAPTATSEPEQKGASALAGVPGGPLLGAGGLAAIIAAIVAVFRKRR